ncbi:EF-hand domain-containing protein [Chromatium okenii]|nr:EF-hand domain-containing protein [Chromatium okenii]
MVESISRFSSGSAILQGVRPTQRPDPAKMAETLVANLDTAKKGYLEVSDLQTAFAQSSTANSTTAVQNAQQVFSAFDSNGDGQATTTEITTTLQALADRQQQGASGAQTGVIQQDMGPGGPGGAGGPPPPPATTGTSAATTVSDPADTNGDGTVSATEAIAAIQSTLAATTAQTTAATTASNTTTVASATTATATTTAANETPSTTRTMTDALQRRIMQLMDAYGLQQNTQQTRTGAASSYQSSLSITA